MEKKVHRGVRGAEAGTSPRSWAGPVTLPHTLPAPLMPALPGISIPDIVASHLSYLVYLLLAKQVTKEAQTTLFLRLQSYTHIPESKSH